jgi:hypothetical protein
MIDNIVIGAPVEGISLKDLGVGVEETTIIIPMVKAIELELFLPRLLVEAGIFKTTSEVKRIARDRDKSTKIVDLNSKHLWRTITSPEFTTCKIGKKIFTLIVGEINT